MRHLFLLLSLFALTGCEPSDSASSGDTDLPFEYHGSWIFDGDSATTGIEDMPIKEEDKLKLQSSYIGMIRDEIRQVDSTGRITSSSYPDELIIRLHVVEEREDGLILRTSNSMNPDATQFTLNTISGGVWRARLLDDSLQVMAGMPDDFWARNKQKPEEQDADGDVDESP